MVHLTTENGSEYVLDYEHKLWERTNECQKSGKLRTTSGSFLRATYELNEPLIMVCPALVAHASGRYIETSPIIKIEVKSDEKAI